MNYRTGHTRPDRRLVRYLFVLCPVLFLSGCVETTQEWDRGELVDRSKAQGVSDNFDAAMEYLYQLDEFDPQQARFQAALHLNQWIATQDADEQWIADPLISRLPSYLRDAPPLQELAEPSFRIEDIKFLQEAIWMRSISEWAVTEPPLDALSQAEETEGLAAADARKLRTAQLLFDWTIRNIQLDEMLPVPAEAATVPAPGQQQSPTASIPGPFRGAPGPGYTYYPWQTLVYGHGDAWQRARVFISLARQQGLDVVMLAVDAGSGEPRPWLPGLLLNNQLYLFDTQLGLPIPGPEGKGIATLTQARKTPELLRALDVEGNTYPITADEIEGVVALIDAAPAYLTQKMKVVESRLTGDRKMVLTVTPSLMARELRNLDGISQVRLWTLPYETVIFRMVVEENPDQYIRFQQGIFETVNPLTKARHQHFRGQFENQVVQDEERQGAKRLYLEARLPDDVLDQLPDNPQLQVQLGLQKQPGMDEQLWQQNLQAVQQIYRMAKMHATYWLGLTHLETGRYQVAADWFKTQVLEGSGETMWTPGARYNLARAYEAIGNLEEARRLLREDESPQQHGNQLRAQWLESSES